MTYPSQTIFDCLPGIVYISDNTTKTIMWCNKCFEKETGYTLAEIHTMGMNFFRTVMHPDDFPQALRAQKCFMNKSQSSFYGFCRIKGKNDKEWKWLNGTAIPFSYDEKGRVKEVICNFVKILLKPDTLMQTNELVDNMLQVIHSVEINLLTLNEINVLKLAIKGYSEKMIGEELHLCRGTIEYCLKECRIKFKVPNMQALIARAKSFGL